MAYFNDIRFIVSNVFWDLKKVTHPIYKRIKYDIRCDFSGYRSIDKKDLLWTNLKGAYFMPKTYVINNVDDFDKVENNEKNVNKIWYLKPTKMGMAVGILVGSLDKIKSKYLDHVKKLRTRNNFVLQEEIKPFLIDGRKFSLRSYLFLMYDTFYFYKEGTLIFASNKFGNGEDMFSQLTNVSYGKKNPNYDHREDNYTTHPYLYKKTFPKILQIMKVVADKYRGKLATDKIILFGVDFLFDKDLNCWLLEINKNLGIITEGRQYKEKFYPLTMDMVYLYADYHNVQLTKNSGRKNGWVKL